MEQQILHIRYCNLCRFYSAPLVSFGLRVFSEIMGHHEGQTA